MVDMGAAAEVGQKMRSAIKAKLTELDCYVDDELPDYIMVMVANKRTKSQMNEDLILFLSTKTSIFVDWLHIVLKKLKEVTATNLDIYTKAGKRKSNELPYVKLKKDKRIKTEKTPTSDHTTAIEQDAEKPIVPSLTDDLPLNVKGFSESRKAMVVNTLIDKVDHHFDIPSLSQVNASNLKELNEIEKQIISVKSRLGLKVEDEVEEEKLRIIVEESRNKPIIKDSVTLVSNTEGFGRGRQIVLDISRNTQEGELGSGIKSLVDAGRIEDSHSDYPIENKKNEHSRITFSKSELQSSRFSPKKTSVHDRLGSYGEYKKESVSGVHRIHESNGKYTGWEGRYRNDSSADKEDRKCTRSYPREGDRIDWQASNPENFKAKGREGCRREELRKAENDKLNSKLNSSRKSRQDLRQGLTKRSSLENSRRASKKGLGLSSKVTVPQTDPQLLEDTFKKREVVSVVKVKPRILPPNMQQANKTLLLKAVADAQKSVSLAKLVGNCIQTDTSSAKYPKLESESPSRSIYTKRSKSNRNVKVRGISKKEKDKLNRCLLSRSPSNRDCLEEKEGEQEYIPKSIKRSLSNLEYVPSTKCKMRREESTDEDNKKQKFIVTLDGVQEGIISSRKVSAKDRLHGRRTPSPIIFENSTASTNSPQSRTSIDKRKIPDELPVVPIALPKIKERCKYFPLCRNGDKCEFHHPSRNCEQFPYCMFGDKCLYLHPNCKFGTSCTRRDCSYGHASGLKQLGSRTAVPMVPVKLVPQTCKYFPHCTNVNCSFHHPKPCKFGKYCKNQAVCNYTHTHSAVPSKSNLTWKSK